jgi:hypothetical protein
MMTKDAIRWNIDIAASRMSYRNLPAEDPLALDADQSNTFHGGWPWNLKTAADAH